MILSVSRRTDIPAFFPRWFMRRLREGFVLARNPMNHGQVSRIALSPDAIDCIVFWTKNPKPLLPYLDEIGARFPFYFQYTLNAYGQDVEENVPPLGERLATMRALSGKTGRARIVWRYDPVLLSPKYDEAWHIETFGRLAREIAPHSGRCVFSFLDFYPKIAKGLRAMEGRVCEEKEMRRLAQAFGAAARENGLSIAACAEAGDYSAFGVERSRCVDPELIGRLTGREICAAKDRNQRPACGCAESVDVGAYNTCRHDCLYCYATSSAETTAARLAHHDEASPLLVGVVEPGDKVTERKLKSCAATENAPKQDVLFS